MANEYTPETLANAAKVDVPAIRVKYNRLRTAGHELFQVNFSRHAVLSPEQVAILRPGFAGEVKKIDSPKHSTPTPAATKTFAAPVVLSRPKVPHNWRASIFVFFAFIIVIGHAGLIWFDMQRLWAMPGMIGGGVVFAFILSGMVLMSDRSEKMGDIRENMLWAVATLESLAIVVHQATFSRYAGEAYIAGLGTEYTWALSAVLCLCSIGATVFYQKVISK